MKMLVRIKSGWRLHSFLLPSLIFLSSIMHAGNITIIDSRHYSNVFGEIRNFRIFLPPGYYEDAQKRYPVIYFFHGWSQRYFGSINTIRADEGESNNGDNIANFVAAHEVIVVKPDGYNRNPDEEYYLRPYNIGPVETNRQFPIYFPELVQFIDANYRTIADRNHRAISGLSMGGFMAFWIGGKYPDLISAVGNFCGSAEFVVGPKNMPVEYRHLDMYKNYGGVNVRLNYGNQDFIRCYHQDMNRVWTQVMNNYEYKIYNADHSTCGLSEMFGFILKTFDNPPEKPAKWDHIDVYPEFSVWGYKLSSDRAIPGFTILENVDQRGFRCSVREFLPDGELMPFVNLSVITPPIYEKNQLYIINDVDTKRLIASQHAIRSDNSGSLKIDINGSIHQVGINKAGDKPNMSIASVEIENMNWAAPQKDVSLMIKLLNKGLTGAKNIKAKLLATINNVTISTSETEFGSFAVNETQVCHTPFTFHVQSDSIEIEKFKLIIQDENHNEWIDFFEIPMKKDLLELKNFEIADGKTCVVANAGVDSTSVFLGSGNGDGVANPGESIVILVKDRNKLWRTNLITSDKYVNPSGTKLRMSDNWGNYDHVGGSAKYSISVIASDCPQNHKVEFFAEYWLPDYPYHIIKQGKIKINVVGRDSTPPELRWVESSGGNIIQASLYDGGKISSVKAKFRLKDHPETFFEIELRDDGIGADRIKSDNVFSAVVPEKKFALYTVEIEAEDFNGNKMTKVCPDIIVLY